MNRWRAGKQEIAIGLWLAGAAVALAALACGNAPVAPDTPATVQAFYATITAQAASGSPFPTRPPDITPTPTSTATPSPSPTPPEARAGNGANPIVPRCQTILTIDGDSADWAGAGAASLPLTTVTYGEGEWIGGQDLSGEAQVCYTDSGLYLSVFVIDDIHVQIERGTRSWRGDGVEFMFDGDLRGDFDDDSMNDDDVHLGLNSGNFDDIPPEAVQYQPELGGESRVPVAVRRDINTGGNYVLEAAVPWPVLGITPEPAIGYGLCIAISDNDHVGAAQQDSMASHCIGLITSNPTTWVTATFD